MLMIANFLLDRIFDYYLCFFFVGDFFCFRNFYHTSIMNKTISLDYPTKTHQSLTLHRISNEIFCFHEFTITFPTLLKSSKFKLEDFPEVVTQTKQQQLCFLIENSQWSISFSTSFHSFSGNLIKAS